MHDQEPVSIGYLDTYRKQMVSEENTLPIKDHNQRSHLQRLRKIPSDLNSESWAFRVVRGGKTPIICHSELNSTDITKLKQHGFIDCYYWYHGMIARDWFRHWRHYQDLLPTDKSRSQTRFLLYSRDFSGTRAYRYQLIEHCRGLKEKIQYNWSTDQVDSSHSAKISIDDSVSPIQIVPETLFDTSKVYLTEKVFKPMVMSQAFILFAPPGSLEYLKSYGFRTFGDVWDESYDKEPDSKRRMGKLLDLITDLATIDQDRFKDLCEKSLPIIDHNRKRFFSEEFQNALINEMRSNFSLALLEQNQGHEHSLDDKSSTDGDDV